MATVHVISKAGEQSSYSDEELRALWQQGALPPDMLYWVEGMGDWRPLLEYFSPPPAAQSFAPSTTIGPGPIGGFSYVKDPRSATRSLKAMLWSLIAVTALSLVSDAAELIMLRSDFTQQQAKYNDIRQGLIGLLMMVAYVLTVVAFAVWIYRANVNCHGFGAQSMEFTPGWSIGYYFIPFLNLYKPYHAMVEIWKVSANPLDWKNQTPGAILPRWWALWLLSGVLGQVSFRVSMSAEAIAELQRAAGVAIPSGLAEVALCVVALSLVSAVCEMQEGLVGRLV